MKLSAATDNRLQEGLRELVARKAVRDFIHLHATIAKARIYDRYQRFFQWNGINARSLKANGQIRYRTPADFRRLLYPSSQLS